MHTCLRSTLFRGAAGIALAALLLGGAGAPALALEPGEFDPADFDSLLGLYAGETGVDYARWKAAGTDALDRFLERAAAYDLTSTLGKEPRAAFLVNAYNARAIRLVIEHYPVASLADIPGFFDKNAAPIAGEERTLNQIEAKLADILPYRPVFAFALAPGAMGMPALAPSAYTSEDLMLRSQQAAAVYLADGPRIKYDREKKIIHVPPQFQTHWTLFENDPKGLLGFLANHIPLTDVLAITKDDPDYAFDPVDWTLNDASGEEDASGEAGDAEEESASP